MLALHTWSKTFPRLAPGRRSLYAVVAFCFFLAAFAGFRWYSSKVSAAGTSIRETKFSRARLSKQASIRATGRTDPRVSLSKGYALLTSYQGPENLQRALSENLASPRSLASADFDEDGVPDLVSSYAFESGGIITMNRGNVDSIYPNAPEAKERRMNGTFTDAPFLSPALAIEVSTPADFIGAGDFDADGHWDIVTASRGGNSLQFLAGDGTGNFAPPRLIDLPGRITELKTGDVNRRDGLTDIVLGIEGSERPALLVFEGPLGALRSTPEVLTLPAPASSIDIGEIDGHYAMDIVATAGNHLMVFHGRDRKLSLDEGEQATVCPARITDRVFDLNLRSVAIGSFSGDGGKDLAVLADDGTLFALTQPRINANEWAKMKRDVQDQAAGRKSGLSGTGLSDEGRVFPNFELDRWQLQTASEQKSPGARTIIKSRVSSVAADTMVLLDPTSNQVEVVSKTAGAKESAKQTQTENSDLPATYQISSMGSDAAPAAVLPVRLDSDALSDLVILRDGVTQPDVVFTSVGKTAPAPPGTSPQYATFSNPAFFSMSAFFSTPGKSSPYPSTIDVSGISDPNTKVRVRLLRFGSNMPSVVDLLLVSPAGQKVMLMSDCGGSQLTGGSEITFDDNAPSFVGPLLATGTYKPTNVDDGLSDNFPSPAPSPPYASTLSAFNGNNLNGTWKLYGEDDGGGGNSIQSSMQDGWTLIFGDDPPPQDFVVNSSADSDDGTCNTADCTLREAIKAANAKPGADSIRFGINSGHQVITPLSPLPNITEAVTIDGTTQTGFAGTPLIELNGSNAGSSADGLVIAGGNSLVRGLLINRFSNNGVSVVAYGNNILDGNYIGTDINGNVDLGNKNDGIEAPAANNLIGGTTPAARNLISGNDLAGVSLASFDASSLSFGNQVQGNFIGTNAAGTAVISNSFFGVHTDSGFGLVNNNTIGGAVAGARNVVAGSTFARVDITGFGSPGTLIQGNYLGTDLTGTRGISTSSGDGVDISAYAHGVTVGGTTPTARNLLSGNWFGVKITNTVQGTGTSTRDCLVQGNYIGTDVNGTAAVRNVFSGVYLLFGALNNTIGGAVIEARNIISGNTRAGVEIGALNFQATFNNVTQNNYIGTDVTGNSPLGNGNNVDPSGGIIVPANADGDQIRQNRIAYNFGSGIRITNVTGNNQPGIRILIADNEIFANTGLGIDLGGQGITPNDPQDTDTGPNLLQNFPELTSISPAAPRDGNVSGSTRGELTLPNLIGADAITINGTLNSTPNQTYTVHWYFSADAQCTTNQAGSRPLVTGKVPGVATDANGNAQFSFPFDFPNGINGGIINCTASDPQGNTSEFSSCFKVGGAAPAVSLSSTTYSASESTATRTVTISRTGSTAGVSTVEYSTSDGAGSNGCSQIMGLASSRCDYGATMGKVTFAVGETSKTISIPVIDDSYAEGSENFLFTLVNPTGASLGAPATATITISDNETTNGNNPINDARYYVRVHYLDFLNREPDTSGWDFWTNQITVCGSDGGCTEVRRVNVSASFFLSIEFQQTGYLIERIYKVSYGDGTGSSTFGGAHQLAVPIVRLNEFLADTQQIQQGVIVNQGNWQQQLEDNKVAFALGFVQRARFTTAFPTTLSPAAFVDALFTKAGVTPSTADRNSAIGEFGSATNTTDVAARGRALRKVAENATLSANEFNRAFVLMQYFGYLRRNPNDPQDSDYTGYDFWLAKLNQFNGNYINAEMVKAFITSIEYKARFGP